MNTVLPAADWSRVQHAVWQKQPALTLLFDLGGVLYENATFDSLNAMLGTSLPEDVLKDRWLRSPAVRAFESGRISPDLFAGECLREWQIALTPDEFLEDFATWVRRPFGGAEKLITDLRAEHEVCCLINCNELHWRRLDDFLGCFDFASSSHLLGEIKPDERVFRRIMSELGVEPDHLLFFDDSLLNVEAAGRFGIRAFLVDGLADTQRVSKEQGLL